MKVGDIFELDFSLNEWNQYLRGFKFKVTCTPIFGMFTGKIIYRCNTYFEIGDELYFKAEGLIKLINRKSHLPKWMY